MNLVVATKSPTIRAECAGSLALIAQIRLLYLTIAVASPAFQAVPKRMHGLLLTGDNLALQGEQLWSGHPMPKLYLKYGVSHHQDPRT